MRILYISTPSFADCDIPLIRAMQTKGYDVTYLLLLAPHNLRYTIINIETIFPKTGVFAADIYPELKVFHDYLDMEKFYVANRTSNKSYSFSYLKKTIAIWKFIRKSHYDIVHTPCFWGWKRILLYFAKRVITTIHDPFPHSGEKNCTSNFNRKLAVRLSRGIILLNNNQKEKFCDLYKVKSDKICVSRLGVYENIRLLTSDMYNERRKHNVLFFGRISPYKGIEYLCEAMDIVRKTIPDATLTIAGSGKMYFDITPYLQRGYIDLQNHFVSIEEVAMMLNQCSICVCPYTDATQSGVVMTSFALLKPVVASNVGGLGEMIEDGKSGFLVEPKNPDELAKAIIKLLGNPILLKQMSDYIESRYFSGEMSWTQIAETYTSFYRRII